jgi:hypothetical protein
MDLYHKMVMHSIFKTLAQKYSTTTSEIFDYYISLKRPEPFCFYRPALDLWFLVSYKMHFLTSFALGENQRPEERFSLPLYEANVFVLKESIFSVKKVPFLKNKDP